jgi:hypothetical protein
VQAACLCAAAGLLYRVFRPALGPGTAFAASTAPWTMESSRLLIAWPSGFQDAGALLFVALALHEAVAGRRWSFLGAGLAGLLCKEVAVVPLVTMVLCPAVTLAPERRRIWLVSIAVLVAVWLAAYAIVYARASFALPGYGGSPWSPLAWSRGLALVPWWSLKGLVSLPAASGPLDVLVLLGLVALAPWPRVVAWLRSRGPEERAWWRWGLLWSVPLVLTLVPFYPGWWPYRLGLVGLGALVAAMVTLRGAHRLALPSFVLLRLVLLAIAPRPVSVVTAEPAFRGATVDVPRLSRLQRFAADVRHAVRARFPTLPHGTAVVWENFPAMTEHAFGDQSALRVWYRDTTLRWMSIGPWMAEDAQPTATIVEFQGDHEPQVALVDPAAMRAMLRANAALLRGDDAASLRGLAEAESRQTDTTARVFLRSVAGKRAYASARMLLAHGRLEEARARVLELLALHPGDVPGRRLLEQIDTALRRSGGAR